MMKKIYFAILLLSLVSCKKETTENTAKPNDSIAIEKKVDTVAVLTKPEIYHLTTELCNKKGEYNPALYSKEELDGTYKIWSGRSGISVDSPFVNDLGDLEEIRRDNAKILAKLDEDFAKSKRTLENLKVVNIPYWQDYKKITAITLQQDYEKSRTQVESYINPSVLLSSKIGSKCTNFAKALNGTDDEIKAEWRKLGEAMSKKNTDPSRVLNDLENRINSSHWKEYATIYLTTFGWGNCANGSITRVSQDENMEKEFEKLFIKLEEECDEP
ncbi:hypothetical protein [Chryseobacterium sp.]|uniref:hypothetical protein n=1 Tax=Chryseobacterium sp. TaxID=1871047 RepID=UPI0038907A58